MARDYKLSGPYGFGVICAGQSVSQLGTGLTGFALGVWIYQTTGSVTFFALISLCTMLPRILLLPVLGALVDRWDRRRTMVASDAVSGSLTVILVLLFWTGHVKPWHLMPVVALASVLGAIQQLAFSSSVPLLVPNQHLGRANGMVEVGSYSATIVAPLAAGALMGRIGVHGVMVIDLVTLAAALSTFAFVRIPQPEKETASRESEAPLLQAALYGWTFIRQRPGLLGLLILFACSNFSLGMVQTLLTPMILSFSTSEMLGRVLFAASLGLLAGGLTMTAWGGPSKRTRGIFGFLGVQGLVLCVAGVREGVLWVAVAAFCFMFCQPVVRGCGLAIWQTKVSARELGRVLAVSRLVTLSSLPLAYLAAGPLADSVFEPLLAVDGPLADSVGRILGVGPGRGIGLLSVVLGAVLLLSTLIARSVPAVRNVERDLPNAVTEVAGGPLPRVSADHHERAPALDERKVADE